MATGITIDHTDQNTIITAMQDLLVTKPLILIEKDIKVSLTIYSEDGEKRTGTLSLWLFIFLRVQKIHLQTALKEMVIPPS